MIIIIVLPNKVKKLNWLYRIFSLNELVKYCCYITKEILDYTRIAMWYKLPIYNWCKFFTFILRDLRSLIYIYL